MANGLGGSHRSYHIEFDDPEVQGEAFLYFYQSPSLKVFESARQRRLRPLRVEDGAMVTLPTKGSCRDFILRGRRVLITGIGLGQL